MFTRIVFAPAILGGKPCIKGTRISVEMILEWVASGASRDDIMMSYPQLMADDVDEAIRYAETAIQSLDSIDDDFLIDELLASNPEFQSLVAKSKTGRRKPFNSGTSG